MEVIILKRLIAIIDDKYQSDLLNVNASDIANQTIQQIFTQKDILENLIFGDGSKLLNYIQSNYIQKISDNYTQNKTNYDASQLSIELNNLAYGAYNNIINQIMNQNVQDLLKAFNITIEYKS